MELHGEFITQHGETVRVEISISDGTDRDITIGDDAGGVFFDEESPVVIRGESTEAQDVMLCQSATLRLLCRDFMPELYRPSCFDARVLVWRGQRLLFMGFIEPMTFRQDFRSDADTLEVNCIDCLAALRYVPYLRTGSPDGPTHAEAVAAAGVRTVMGLLDDCLGVAAEAHPEAPSPQLHYDGCRRVSARASATDDEIFSAVGVSELLLLGDDEDGVWTLADALTEALRYLSLRIVQEGADFYVYGRDALSRRVNGAGEPVAVSLANAGDDGTTLSIGEMYNRVELRCEVKAPGGVVEDPLDAQALTPVYTGRTKYLTEYSVPDRDEPGKRYFAAFDLPHLMNGNDAEVKGENASRTDIYARVYANPRWQLPRDLHLPPLGRTGQNTDITGLCLQAMPGTEIVTFGRHRVCPAEMRKDNAPVASLDMQTYLCIGVNGNGDDTEAGAQPSEQTLLATAPRAVYRGRLSGGALSPADAGTTNYLVISGTLYLASLRRESAAPDLFYSGDTVDLSGLPRVDTTLGDDKKRYLVRQFWSADGPGDTPVRLTGDNNAGVVPPSSELPGEMEFKYSAVGDGTDRVSKVGVLACMLRVGDKCLVETGDGSAPDCYEWRTFKPQTQCADDDEYYAQSFTIGINPKIGDKLVGTEFPVQNNITFAMGIDAEGTAIPMRHADALSGPVVFEILGPANITWDDVTRRHRTFFRHTKWTTTSRPLMAHVSTIYVRDFAMKLYSDNGLLDRTDPDADLIYISDERHDFANTLDCDAFRICSALTAQERAALGCDSIDGSISVALYVRADGSSTPMLSFYNTATGDTCKPEQMCVDALYAEFCRPRVELEQTLEDTGTNVRRFGAYTHPALPGRRMLVQAVERDLRAGTARLTLKETWT